VPLTYELIVRNIGDTAGDAIIRFTPDPSGAWTQVAFGTAPNLGCNIGGAPGGADECTANLLPRQSVAMIITGRYVAAAATVSIVEAAEINNNRDGNPANNQATDTTLVLP